MSTVIITPHAKAKIEVLIAQAREHVVPWSLIAASAVATDTNELTLAERKSGAPKRPESQHIMLGNVEVAFSFEEQPAGICRHMSVALGKPHLLPPQEAVEFIAKEFGFTEFPPSRGRVWVEEYEPGYHAINVVELDEPAAPLTMQ